MKEHGEVQAQRKGRHPARRALRETFVQEIQSADQECQHQRVLPHFRREQDDGRKECDEKKSDQAGKVARSFA